jgi:hypothetical protein
MALVISTRYYALAVGAKGQSRSPSFDHLIGRDN